MIFIILSFFIDIAQFQTIVDGFISMINSLAQEVEKEKLKAIGAHNLAKSMAKQREAQHQQLQVICTTKKIRKKILIVLQLKILL